MTQKSDLGGHESVSDMDDELDEQAQSLSQRQSNTCKVLVAH